jgi:hypothetical protein
MPRNELTINLKKRRNKMKKKPKNYEYIKKLHCRIKELEAIIAKLLLEKVDVKLYKTIEKSSNKEE